MSTFGETRNGFRYWYGWGWFALGACYALMALTFADFLYEHAWLKAVSAGLSAVVLCWWTDNAAERYRSAQLKKSMMDLLNRLAAGAITVKPRRSPNSHHRHDTLRGEQS